METATFTSEDIERINENLAFLKANPSSNANWAAGVEAEARAAGILKAPTFIGCNCPKEPYFEPPYGGDLV